MISRLVFLAAEARNAEFRRAAAARNLPPGERTRPRGSGEGAEAGAGAAITLRFAFPDDAAALERLAQLDSAPVPAAPLLLAEVEGQLRAALSLASGQSIADPFHRTEPLLDLLRARGRQLLATASSDRRPIWTARLRSLIAWR